MSRDDDLWRARLRADATARPDPGVYRPGTPSFLGKVVSTGTLTVGKFVKVVPVSATGTEADNAAAVLTAGTATVLAYPVGPGTPATGDYVVVRRVNYRWVFDEPTAGGGGGPTPGFGGCCASTPIPDPLSLTFAFRAGTSSANYAHMLPPTTLTIHATHPPYVGATEANCYFSPTFADDNGQTDYFMLTCISGQFQISFGQVGFGAPSACMIFRAISCSPFLIHAQPNNPNSGLAGSCISGSISGTGLNYGGDPADMLTIS